MSMVADSGPPSQQSLISVERASILVGLERKRYLQEIDDILQQLEEIIAVRRRQREYFAKLGIPQGAHDGRE